MALQGTIDTFALPDVLRLLASSAKTGELAIDGDRGTGRIWVSDGSIVATDLDLGVHPSTGSSEITEGLFQLLRFVEGEFSFTADVAPGEPLEAADVEESLASSSAMLTELQAIEENVPGIGCWMTLRSDIDTDSVTLSRDQWRVLATIGAGTSVAEIAASFELGELESLRRANDLVAEGVAAVGTDPTLVIPQEPVQVETVAVETPIEDGEPVEAEISQTDEVTDAQAADPVDAILQDPFAATEMPSETTQPVVGDPFAGTIDAPTEAVDHFAPSIESIDPFAAPAAGDPFATAVPDEPLSAEIAPAEWPAPNLDGVVPVPPAAPEASEFAPPPPPPAPIGDEAFPPPPPAPPAGIVAPVAEVGQSIPAPPASPIAEPVAQIEGVDAAMASAPSEVAPVQMPEPVPVPNDSNDMARQLASLSPAAAQAVAEAARADSPEQRDAAIADAETEDQSVDRGLLLKFLGRSDK